MRLPWGGHVRRETRPAPGAATEAESWERPVGQLLESEQRKLWLRAPCFQRELAFLREHGLAEASLVAATRLAAIRGTSPRDELLAAGLPRQAFWAQLAAELGVAFCDSLDSAVLAGGPSEAGAAVRSASIQVYLNGERVRVTAPRDDEIARLRHALFRDPGLAARIRIAAPETIRAFVAERRRDGLVEETVNRLARKLPTLSAKRLAPRQTGLPAALIASVFALGAVAPIIAFFALVGVSALFFLNCTVWKLAAALRRPPVARLEHIPSGQLPSYSVMVPLYREAAVIPDLVRHLTALDYPASKLQIMIVLEADDAESHAAMRALQPIPNVEVLTVPPGGPRTKPKALTYALPFARGDMVVVYDAEDRPEPDQLRKAVAQFRARPDLGCVQARLAPDNETSWFARMFALEYAANFEVVLPALASWNVPLPLGGTSNHFPRAILEEVGAWDPFNVTEDADLGVRLARFGYASATILSRTYEEAPVTFRQWLPQRRRWIKGWIQTAVVCRPGRAPTGLELPLRQSLAVHAMITAGVLGLLLYPLSVLAFALMVVLVAQEGWPDTWWSVLTIGLNLNMLGIGAAAVISTWRGLKAQKLLRLAPLMVTLPIYWALMCLAAWGAFFQFLRDPNRWEKTEHGVARDRRGRARSAALA